LASEDDWTDLARPSADNGGLTMIETARLYGVPLPTVRTAYVWGQLGKPDEWSVWHADASRVHRFFGQQDQRDSMLSAAAGRARSKAAALREQLERGKS
jgi:hypothetical protein